MGCRKITYYQAGEANGQTAFFSGGRLEKKESALKNRIDYYPFGLTFNSYKRQFSKKNKMNTFQDQEYDEETGWVQFKWRNHQPELGRFFNVDPLAEDYYYNSPYAFSENKVTAHIELEGLEAVRAPRPRPGGRSGGNLARIRESVSNAASVSRRPSGFATLSTRQGTMFRRNVTYSTSRGNGTKSIQGSSGTNLGFSDNQHTFGTRAGGVAKVLNDIRGFAQNIVDNAETITVSESFTKAGGFDLSLGSDITVDNFQTTLQLKELETKFNEGVAGLARGEMSQEEFNELPMEEQSMRLNAARLVSGPSPLQIVNQAISNSEVVSEEREDLPSISPSN